MNTNQEPNYQKWLETLENITRQELGLDLADLPDTMTYQDFKEGTTPDDAFQDYLENWWSDYAPLDSTYTQEYNEFTDADPGL